MNNLIIPLTINYDIDLQVGFVKFTNVGLVVKMNPGFVLSQSIIKDTFGNVAYRVIKKGTSAENGEIGPIEIIITEWAFLSSKAKLK